MEVNVKEQFVSKPSADYEMSGSNVQDVLWFESRLCNRFRKHGLNADLDEVYQLKF
jgi:hypothetical protein